MQTYCSPSCQAGKHSHPPTSDICASVWLVRIPLLKQNRKCLSAIHIFHTQTQGVFGFCKFILRSERLTSKSSHFVVICKTVTQASLLKPKLRERCDQCLHSQLTTKVYQHLASLLSPFWFANIALRGRSLEKLELLFG